MKHWVKQGWVELPTEDFFNEIEFVCQKYGLSISHEDSGGAFVIDKFKEDNLDWIRGALFTEEATQFLKDKSA